MSIFNCKRNENKELLDIINKLRAEISTQRRIIQEQESHIKTLEAELARCQGTAT